MIRKKSLRQKIIIAITVIYFAITMSSPLQVSEVIADGCEHPPTQCGG